MKFFIFVALVVIGLNANSKLYVCYDSKTVSSTTGNLAYLGCKRYHDSCTSNGKLHFGKYPTSGKASGALNRCLKSSPKFVNNGKAKGSSVSVSTQTATVTGLDPNGDGFLSLRKKPKQREIGKLYNGDKVEILSQSGKYYKVKDMKSGMIGYAHSNWIRKSSRSTTASTSTSQKQGTVHGLDPNGDGFLSVRTKPKGKKIGKLYNGDKVAILGQRGAWYKVRTASGIVGWSHGDWVRIEKNFTVKKSIKTKKLLNGIWITPSSITCRSNNGTIDKYGNCKANWENAKSICSASGGTLAKEELLAVITDCGGSLEDLSKDFNNKNYEECYKEKGFNSKSYWSGETYADDLKEAWSVSFDNGYQTYSISKLTSNSVRCISCMSLLKKYNYLLHNLPKPCTKDREVVITALKNESTFNFLSIDDKFKKDREISLLAVKHAGTAFAMIDDKFKKDREFVLETVKDDGHLLNWVGAEFQNDKEVCLLALKNTKDAYKYVGGNLKNDDDILRVVSRQVDSNNSNDFNSTEQKYEIK